MATTTDGPDVLQGYESGRRWSWPALILVAVLSMAVGVGVGWLAFAPDEGGQPIQVQAAEEPDRAAQRDAVAKQVVLSMINAYVAAWNAGDGRGVVSLMSEFGAVGAMRMAEPIPFLSWRLDGSNVALWQIFKQPQRRELVKLVGQAKGLFGKQPEVADVLWINMGSGSGEAWALIAGRSKEHVNSFYDEVIRFKFAFEGDPLDAGQPFFFSAEHLLPPEVRFPGY